MSGSGLASIFNICAGLPSAPVALHVLSGFRDFKTSSTLISLNRKCLIPSNTVGVIVRLQWSWLSSTDCNKSDVIEVWYSFIELAIAASSVTLTLSVSSFSISRGEGRGYLTNFYARRLRPEAQPITPLIYHFSRKRYRFRIPSIVKRTLFSGLHSFNCSVF